MHNAKPAGYTLQITVFCFENIVDYTLRRDTTTFSPVPACVHFLALRYVYFVIMTSFKRTGNEFKILSEFTAVVTRWQRLTDSYSMCWNIHYVTAIISLDNEFIIKEYKSMHYVL